MNYARIPIREAETPGASDPSLQHLPNTYVSETNKTFTIWTSFAGQDLNFRPHTASSSIIEIMRHQLLSERRFFAEFLGLLEVPPAEVLPARQGAVDYADRLVELARPRLNSLALQPMVWWLQRVPFFDVERERIWIFWRRVLHTAHHRTQLTVYQRLIGLPVLPTYGPTGDVSWNGADPTLTVEAAGRK